MSEKFGLYLVVFVVFDALTIGVGEQNSDIVYEMPNLISVKVRKRNPQTGNDTYFSFSVSKQLLRHYNTSKDQIERGYMDEKDESTVEIVLPGGHRLPVVVKEDQVVRFHNRKGKVMFNLSKQGFLARSIQDLKNDESLIPLRNTTVMLTRKRKCDLERIEIYTTPNSVKNFPWWTEQGIFIVAINPSTCDVTLKELFPTYDFGYFRELKWTIDTIAAGRLVVLTSLRDGSSLLGDARDSFKRLGSLWSKYYSFCDTWINVFIKGGKSLGEFLVPNSEIRFSGSPVMVHVPIHHMSSFQSSHSCYQSWPTSEEWEARRYFCISNDGFGTLCDCRRPFEIGLRRRRKNIPDTRRIPMVILARDRTRHLFRLLESVGKQNGVSAASFLLSIDGPNPTTHQLAFILGIKTVTLRSEGSLGKAKVTNNLRFGLYHAHRTFPLAKEFIVLEDDLVLAPDFYRYMLHLAPIFEMDKSVFCVSAFNHLSFPHTSFNPATVYRAHTNPALGWMVSRETLESIVPKLLPRNIEHDWDFFLGSKFVRGNRVVLIPEVNRSFHPSTKGLHVYGSLFTERMYLSREMYRGTDTKFVPLRSLTEMEYDKRLHNLLLRAAYVNVDEAGNFTKPLREGHVYVMYVQKQNEDDDNSFRYVGDILRIWNNDARDHYHYAWILNYMKATLFVVGVPLSPYSKYMRQNETYLVAPSTIAEDLQDDITSTYAVLTFPSHLNGSNLPKF